MRMRQYRTSVQTELISLDAAKLSSGALKEKEQLVHSTQETNLITQPCFPPSNISIFCKKKERGKTAASLLFIHLKCQKQLETDTSPSSGSNVQTRGHFLCHRKYEQSLGSLFFSNLLSENTWRQYYTYWSLHYWIQNHKQADK